MAENNAETAEAQREILNRIVELGPVHQMWTSAALKLRANLVQLAQGNLELGVLHEPRAFYDVITLDPDGNITPGHAEVFKNGEQFPIRLTHLTAALNFQDNEEDPQAVDEREIQRVGMRMRFHDQWYMNPQFLPIPLWGNKVVAAAPQVSVGTSAWQFDVPFILSSRDTMRVEVQLGETPDSPRQVSVTFTGIGLLSGRPYLLSATTEIDSDTATVVPTTNFRNDGSEPIIVAEGTVNVSAPVDDQDPTGDIRQVSVQVRQIGNGTNADWFQGPQNIGADRMPGPLWGVRSGRAVVHTFPGDGLLWEPGEGISLDLQGLTNTPPNVDVHIALNGYITIF
jgi:hypothetical protein